MMNFWIIHIVLIAIVYTGTNGTVGSLTHLHEQVPMPHLCAAADGSHHDEDSTPCSKADCAAQACCCTHNHQLQAVGSAVQGTGILTSCEFHRQQVQSSLPQFPVDIFHPPVIG